jgi:hypothetical protein
MKYELVTDYTNQLTESNELNNIYKGYIGNIEHQAESTMNEELEDY